MSVSRSELRRRAHALRALVPALRSDLALLAQRERTLVNCLENPELAESVQSSLTRVTLERRTAQAHLRTVRATLEALDVRSAEGVERIEALTPRGREGER